MNEEKSSWIRRIPSTFLSENWIENNSRDNIGGDCVSYMCNWDLRGISIDISVSLKRHTCIIHCLVHQRKKIRLYNLDGTQRSIYTYLFIMYDTCLDENTFMGDEMFRNEFNFSRTIILLKRKFWWYFNDDLWRNIIRNGDDDDHKCISKLLILNRY